MFIYLCVWIVIHALTKLFTILSASKVVKYHYESVRDWLILPGRDQVLERREQLPVRDPELTKTSRRDSRSGLFGTRHREFPSRPLELATLIGLPVSNRIRDPVLSRDLEKEVQNSRRALFPNYQDIVTSRFNGKNRKVLIRDQDWRKPPLPTVFLVRNYVLGVVRSYFHLIIDHWNSVSLI